MEKGRQQQVRASPIKGTFGIGTGLSAVEASKG